MPQSEKVSWDRALELLESGRIVHTGQSHARVVTLVDSDGRSYRTSEPEIDAIMQALRRLPDNIRTRITVATE